MLDTSTSSTERWRPRNPRSPDRARAPGRINPFNGEKVAKLVASPRPAPLRGLAGSCIFTMRTRSPIWPARSRRRRAGAPAGGRDALGRRTAAIIRAVELRCGIDAGPGVPSTRYGSQPTDGPAKGQRRRAVGPDGEGWYATVGYDRKNGKPRKELLRSLDLDWLAKDLYGKK